MYSFYRRFKTLKTYGHWTAIQELLFRVALKQLNSDAADKSGCKMEWLIVLHHLSHHSSPFLLHGQGTGHMSWKMEVMLTTYQPTEYDPKHIGAKNSTFK